jgi:hypothetical protein
MAEVIAADMAQLTAWSHTLPPANSDVQCSVRARIDRRIALGGQERDGADTKAPPRAVDDSVAHLRSLLGLLNDPSSFERGFSVH